MPIYGKKTGEVVDYSGAQQTQTRRQKKWWLEAKNPHPAIWSVAKKIEKNLLNRQRFNYMASLMYDDTDIDLYAVYGSQARIGNEVGFSTRTTLNIIRNCVDTVASMIAKDRPKLKFDTDDADYQTRIKCERLSKYVSGVIDNTHLYQLAEKVFTQAAIFGTGALKLYADKDSGKIMAEKVNMAEILVDDLEGVNEKPTQLHQRKFMNRDQLIEQFPDFEEEIDSASGPSMSSDHMADVIPVIESWHLKSGPNATDGRHTICIENATLFSEEYTKTYYPILFWRWYPSIQGFFGRGIVLEIGSIQKSINKLLRLIDICQELVAVPVIFSPKAAMVTSDHLLSNEIGRLVEYFGDVPPQIATPPAVQSEIYQYVWLLEQKAYNSIGLNQNMAQGQKPAGGLDSAVALREMTDISTGRFQIVSVRYEEWFTEIAEVIVDLSKDLFEENPDLAIKVKQDDSLEVIKWSEVDMDKDRFEISVFPVSAMPSTPAGRLQWVTELSSQGIIQREQILSLLNFPDTKKYSSLETSTVDLVQKSMGKIKESGKYTNDLKPIKQMDLNVAIPLATKEVVLACVQGISDDTISLLRNYLDHLHGLLPPPPPPPPPQMPTGGMPPMPMAPTPQ